MTTALRTSGKLWKLSSLMSVSRLRLCNLHVCLERASGQQRSPVSRAAHVTLHLTMINVESLLVWHEIWICVAWSVCNKALLTHFCTISFCKPGFYTQCCILPNAHMKAAQSCPPNTLLILDLDVEPSLKAWALISCGHALVIPDSHQTFLLIL